jgi:hypothetical protein
MRQDADLVHSPTTAWAVYFLAGSGANDSHDVFVVQRGLWV